MIKILNPYTDTAKTAEIMSRYRPIAPKPMDPWDALDEGYSSVPQKMKQSPYLTNLWSQLQARPTRTRKRGRAFLSPLPVRRQRTQIPGFCIPWHETYPANQMSLQGFANDQLPPQMSLPADKLVTLSLLPCSPSVTIATGQPTIPEFHFTKQGEEKELSCTAHAFHQTPLEKNLLLQLQGPTVSNVTAPQPVRPVGSIISVGCINESPSQTQVMRSPKKPGVVEKEVESETLPVVISDSNYRVRMANSAYNEMIGQPDCPWLDTLATGNAPQRGGSCRRISGEVALHLVDSQVPIPSNGFSCIVRIDWEVKGRKKSLTTFCDVVRLFCESMNYVFAWRFHTRRSMEASQPSCDI